MVTIMRSQLSDMLGLTNENKNTFEFDKASWRKLCAAMSATPVLKNSDTNSAGKYEIVACIGDEHDYTRECVDVTNSWKDARNAFFNGADVYHNGKRVYFIDHKAINDAFETLAKYYIMMASYYFWEDGLEFEDEVAIKDAQDVLEKNGFKLNANGWPDGEWEDKIVKRSIVNNDPLSVPFYRRSFAIPVYSADTHELVRVESGKCETDELPF